MTWWQSLPAVATAISLLFIPGLMLGAALGARGPVLAAIAPVASCGFVGPAGIIGGLLDVGWSVRLLIVVTIAASCASLCIHCATKHKYVFTSGIPRARLRDFAPLLTALIAPVILITVWMVRTFPTPASFVQAYDNVFHLNAIQYIVETGQASSLTLGHMIQPGSGLAIYPSVWHSLAALIVQVCNVNVFVAESVLTLAVAAVLSPFACVSLVRAVLGNKMIPLLGAGILSASFWVLPFQSIQRGPLLPNLLSYCLLPLVIIAMAGLFGLLHARIMSAFTMTAMLLIGVVALFTSQPNGFTALLVFFIPMFLGALVRYMLRLWRSGLRWVAALRPLAILLPAGVAFSALWSALLLPYNKWQPSKTVPRAIGDVLTGSLTNQSFNVMASLLALLGVLVICHRRRGYWMIGAFFLSGVLYVTAAATPSRPLRNILAGNWYEDTPRLAALVPLFTLVLDSVGVQSIAAAVAHSVSKVPTNFKQLPKVHLANLAGTSVQTVAGCLVLSAMTYFLIDPGVTKQPTSITPPHNR